MKTLTTIIISLGLAFAAYGQCDTSAIFHNDSSNAVCFDTLYSKVLVCYSNNYPDHNDGYNSPFTLTSTQDIYYMCLYPDTASSFTPLYETTETTVGCTYTYTFGVGTNGVKYDPSSAEYFVDSSGADNINWHVEARYIFSANFGNNGGHLNPFGEYHYHSVPKVYFRNQLGIDSTAHSPIVGYAADGFPMYYKYVYSDPLDTSSSIMEVTSGYSLKSGTRPGDGYTAPDGSYTGLYYEDYEYSSASTVLDECNGRWGKTPDFPDGTYYYVLTDNYPYIPRCFKGTAVDNSYRVGPGNACPSSTAQTDCSDEPVDVYGCTDPFSCNYNPSATIDDGSCSYDYASSSLSISSCNSYTSPAGNTYSSSGTYTDTLVATGCDTIYTITLTLSSGATATRNVTQPTSCGASDGSIMFGMPSGGSGPFEFSIDSGVTYSTPMPPTFSNLGAGDYWTVLKDGSGCEDFELVTLSATGGITATASLTSPDCVQDNGWITINVSGGTSPYTYSIDSGTTSQSTNFFTGLVAGDYTIVVTDSSGCTTTFDTTLTDGPANFSFTFSEQDADCGANGFIDGIGISGGSPAYTYSMDGGANFQSSQFFGNLAAGTYTIIAEDANGCVDSTSHTIGGTDAVTYTSVTTDPTCGANNGQIVLTATSGDAPFSYSIDNDSTNQASGTFTGLGDGYYGIYIVDNNGCEVYGVDSLNGGGNALFITTYASTDANCGLDNGRIYNINHSGGTGTVTYSIDAGQTYQASNNFTDLPGATYTVIIKDSLGCMDTSFADIIAYPAVVIASVTTQDALCANTASGSIDISLSSGTPNYHFSIDGGSSFSNDSSFTGVAAGTYTIVAKDDNACTDTTTATISAPDTLSYTAALTHNNCGPNDGSITITATGGTPPYQYSITNGTSYQSSNSFTGLPTAAYQVAVQDSNGCVVYGTESVTGAGITFAINAVIPYSPTCAGGNDGSALVFKTGVSGSHQLTIDGFVTTQSSTTFTGLSAGTYTLEALTSDSCYDSYTFTITDPVAPHDTISQTICFGDTYDGYGTAGVYVDTFNTTGCDSFRTLILSVNQWAATTINQIICYGDSYEGYSATGTYLDTFSTALCDSVRTLNLTVRAENATNITRGICQGDTLDGYYTTGVYTDVFTDRYGCDSTRTLDLTVSNYSSLTLDLDLCAGDSYYGYTTTGTYRDTFAGTNCDSIRILNLTILPNVSGTESKTICYGDSYAGYSTTGIYTDTLTAANGCDSVRTLTLVVLPLDSTYEAMNICAGESYHGYNTTGVYTDTYTNANGCDSIYVIDLTVESPNTNTESISICQGDSVLLGGSYQTTGGNYTDTLTSAAGCDSLIVATTLTVNALPTSPTITQSGASLSVSGSFSSYQWYMGSTAISGATSASYTATANGSYSVVVTNANGCSATSNTVTVTGVGIAEIDLAASLKLYPNPTQGGVTIDLGHTLSGVVQVTNILGQDVMQLPFKDQKQLQFDLDVRTGVYFVTVQTTHGKVVRRLMVE